MQARGAVDPIHVRVLACLLGVIVCKDLLAVDVALNFVAQPDRFHISFIEGFPRLPPTAAVAWTLAGVTLLSFVAALLLTSGSRLSALWLTLFYGGALVSDALGYASNLYLLALLLGVCALAPLTAPSCVWPRLIGQVTVSAVYLGAGVGKLEPEFLSGRVLEAVLYHDSYYPWLGGWHTPAGFRVLAWLTALTELGLAVALWHPRASRYALIVGVGLHASIAPLIPVRIFSHLMVASYVLFVPAWKLERAEAWVAEHIRPALRAPACVVAAIGLDLLDPFAHTRVVALVELAVALGLYELWRRRGTAPVRTPRPSPRLGLVMVVCYAAFQAVAIVKPWLGFSKFCSWRMFSEVLTLKVETEVLHEGSWRKAVFPNAAPRWSSTKLRYYWTSLSEESFYLRGYQRWLAQHYHLGDGVRLAVHYSLFNAGPRELFIGPE